MLHNISTVQNLANNCLQDLNQKHIFFHSLKLEQFFLKSMYGIGAQIIISRCFNKADITFEHRFLHFVEHLNTGCKFGTATGTAKSQTAIFHQTSCILTVSKIFKCLILSSSSFSFCLISCRVSNCNTGEIKQGERS